jgi:hypothetical protein
MFAPSGNSWARSSDVETSLGRGFDVGSAGSAMLVADSTIKPAQQTVEFPEPKH